MRRLPALLCGAVCAGAALAVLALALRTPVPAKISEDGPTQAQIDAINEKYGLEPPVKPHQTPSVDWGWSVRP